MRVFGDLYKFIVGFLLIIFISNIGEEKVKKVDKFLIFKSNIYEVNIGNIC